ncbi:transcriptional regulator, TetR family [Geosporobacter subterraneus DSM 17957]|uniref:Transcriptional regulator, TetR family n=1 Tax=Geosporobacter subterraneus DSM 17957 TaxID=1121919 RepID=A0A1M6NUQ0_9FIRM|nr:TetR/AcrR family transcriptional regulator [Geosporobacter subterraneus]SHJ99426.1 transcriptional regulator, TetR family [Geosporobacter subterraneus DSM 17957]
MTAVKDRRTEILQASVKIFSKQGFHDAKIDDVAQAAGVAKGTVYQYFSSKQELFQEMIKYAVERYTFIVKEIVYGENDIEEKIYALAVKHGEFLKEHIEMAEVVPHQVNVSKEMRLWIMEQKKHLFLLLEEMIENGKNRGEIRKDVDKEIAVISIMGSLFLYYEKELREHRGMPQRSEPKPLVEFLMRALH